VNAASEWLLLHESALRTGVFVALVLVLGTLERVLPFRRDARPARRQLVNLALITLDTALIRLVFPLLGIAFATRMAIDGIGVFNRLDWAPALEIALALLLLDLAIYGQHRMFHRVPLLWRMHRVHHSDLAFDLTLGVRFHPFEIALSQLYKFVVIALVGAAPVAVLAFEIVLLAGSLATHADVALPARLDRALRRLLVTPSMHRIHHSVRREETDSNYGFHLSIWDRLFRSYREEPRDDPRAMPIGLPAFRDDAGQTLPALLWQPFRQP